jgi:hypothetical protein
MLTPPLDQNLRFLKCAEKARSLLMGLMFDGPVRF